MRPTVAALRDAATATLVRIWHTWLSLRLDCEHGCLLNVYDIMLHAFTDMCTRESLGFMLSSWTHVCARVGLYLRYLVTRMDATQAYKRAVSPCHVHVSMIHCCAHTARTKLHVLRQAAAVHHA